MIEGLNAGKRYCKHRTFHVALLRAKILRQP
jgi:hypothetical protein